MRHLLVVLVVAVAAAVTASCASGPDIDSCGAYYDSGPAGVTPDQVAFCLEAGATKQDGNCCVSDAQCLSGKCCPYGATSCGSAPARSSCECYTP